MPRTGTRRGMISRPRRGRTFALQPATRTGAASALSKIGDGPGLSKRKGDDAQWQRDALTYYESLPPVGFVMDFKANTVAACDFNVNQRTDDGNEPVVGDEQIDRLMAALVGPRGGIEELRRRAAVLVEVTGEAYLVGTPVEDESEAVWWEFLSIEEILLPDQTIVGGGQYRRDYGLGGEKEALPDEAYIARFWRSDARYSHRPACGLRRCLATCRELMLLSQMTEAIIASRLPMGLLLVPNTIEHISPLTRQDDAVGLSGTAVGDDEPSFMDDLIEHLSAPITDFDSASTLVPMVIEADREELEAIKVVDLARSLDSYAAGLREEMYGRLAVGMDVPPEILQGKGGLNHWTGSNVDNEFLFRHVQPVGELIADFLTYAYLRPMLQAEGMDVKQAATYSIEFDASPLANNQDDHIKAKDLWADALISDRAVVEKQGWDPDQVMPDEQERQRRMVERLLFTKVITLSDKGWKFLGLDPKLFEAAPDPAAQFGGGPPGQPAPDPTGQPTPPPQPGKKGDAEDEADQTDTPDKPTVEDEAAAAEQKQAPRRRRAQAKKAETAALLVERLGVRADAAYDAARRSAGSRILTAANRHAAFKGRFAQTGTEDIPAGLSAADLAALNLTIDQCVGDPWSEFRGMAQAGLVGVLVEAGYQAPAAVDASARIVNQLTGQLHAWLVDGFHKPFRRYQPGGGRFKVPAHLIEDAVTSASAPLRAA